MKILFTRQGMVIGLTLACIAALVATYLFKYVPDNEQKLKARRFRALERTQLNLESKIQNSFQFLETQLSSYADSQNADKNRMDVYLGSLNKADAGFRLGQVYVTDAADTNRTKIIFDNDSVRCDYMRAQPGNDIGLQINYSSESFMRSLLPKNLFDEFILIKDSCLLFATFPAGNQKIRQDSILHFMTSLPVSSEGQVQFAGQQYRIFLQPVSIDNKSQWILGGLLQEKRFIDERSQLNPKKVLTLITISIMLLILLPWIKLFFMGNRDRLTHTDGFLSFIVAMLMMCMIFFVFARELPAPTYSKSLHTLSDSISKIFNGEIRTAKDLLNAFDEAIIRHDSLRCDILCLNGDRTPAIAQGFNDTTSDKMLDGPSKKFLDSISPTIKKLKFNYVYWLDGEGSELYNWTGQDIVRPHQNFSNRRYFTGHRNRTRSDTIVDQVVSWTTGEFRTVISKTSKLADARVVAISTNIRAMEDHILPEGFTAMIVNWRGDVLYHSDKAHNLNEYLPEEFEDSSQLKSALYSRSREEFSAGYLGSRHHVLITPLEQSYFLLLLRNQSFENTRDVNAFSFALSMYGIFFLVVLLQYICMVSLFSGRHGLNSKSRLVDTLFPSKSLQPAYRCAAVGNLFMILTLACFNETSLLVHIYMLLSAVGLNTIFINLVCAVQHGVQNNYRMAVIKQKNAGVVSAFLLLYNIAAAQVMVPHEFMLLFLFETTIVVGLLLLYTWFRHKRALPGRHIGSDLGFIRSYTWMSVTRIIITSGIPVLFFYVDAYNYEQGLQTRHAQKQFAFRYSRSLQSQKSSPRIFIDSNLISEFKVSKGVMKLKKDLPQSIQNNYVFDVLRLLDDTISISNNNLYHPGEKNDAGIFYDGDSYTREIPAKKINLVIKSKPNQIQLFPGRQGIWYNWVMLFIGLVVFYHVIKRILDKIFAIHFTAQSTTPDIDQPNDSSHMAGVASSRPLMEKKLLHKTGCLDQTQQFNFIIATAGAGTAEAIRQIKQDSSVSKKIFILDLHVAFHTMNGTEKTWIEEASQTKCNCLLIDHFEWLLHNYHLHLPLMKLVEKWIHSGSGSVSVLSDIHPTDFYDRLCELGMSTKDIDAKKAAEFIEHAHRWEQLLSPFHIAFMGMTRLDNTQQENGGLLQFLEQELQWGDFLNQCFKHYKDELVSTTVSKSGNANTEAIPVSNS